MVGGWAALQLAPDSRREARHGWREAGRGGRLSAYCYRRLAWWWRCEGGRNGSGGGARREEGASREGGGIEEKKELWRAEKYSR